jgi:DNA-binding CsgD family transcriptional regulator
MRRIPLTPRENDVIALVASSYSCQQIAKRMGISHRTVENHKQAAMNKLGLHDIAAITRWALAKGLVRNEHN